MIENTIPECKEEYLYEYLRFLVFGMSHFCFNDCVYSELAWTPQVYDPFYIWTQALIEEIRHEANLTFCTMQLTRSILLLK